MLGGKQPAENPFPTQDYHQGARLNPEHSCHTCVAVSRVRHAARGMSRAHMQAAEDEVLLALNSMLPTQGTPCASCSAQSITVCLPAQHCLLSLLPLSCYP